MIGSNQNDQKDAMNGNAAPNHQALLNIAIVKMKNHLSQSVSWVRKKKIENGLKSNGHYVSESIFRKALNEPEVYDSRIWLMTGARRIKYGNYYIIDIFSCTFPRLTFLPFTTFGSSDWYYPIGFLIQWNWVPWSMFVKLVYVAESNIVKICTVCIETSDVMKHLQFYFIAHWWKLWGMRSYLAYHTNYD